MARRTPKGQVNASMPMPAVRQWRDWCTTVGGSRGGLLQAALLALQALRTIEPFLVYELMRPRLSPKDAAEIIVRTVLDTRAEKAAARLRALDDEAVKLLFAKALQVLRDQPSEAVDA